MAGLILIVEDDFYIREDLADILRNEGYEILTASNGQEACDRLRSQCALPDVILLDLMMPIMDGWQFRAEQLKDASLAQIPVIVLSGAADIRKEAAALGAAGYASKPFKLDALVGTIRRTCLAP